MKPILSDISVLIFSTINPAIASFCASISSNSSKTFFIQVFMPLLLSSKNSYYISLIYLFIYINIYIFIYLFICNDKSSYSFLPSSFFPISEYPTTNVFESCVAKSEKFKFVDILL